MIDLDEAQLQSRYPFLGLAGKRIKVLFVFGTRPEAIKMAPVVRALARRPERFETRICVTGQHREMLDQVLDLFQIAPDYDLDIMRPGQSLADVTSAILQGLLPILHAEQPDWMLVQGDTTTAMSAGLAAFYARVPVAHIEAGLRTYDLDAPFPEELNRRVIGVLAALHFAPTTHAAANLRREGVLPEQIVVSGNTVIDAQQQVAALPFDPRGTPLADLPFGKKRLILVTAHRRENFGRGMIEICAGLRTIAASFPEVHLVCPVHLNPNVHEPFYEMLGDVPNITLLSPLEYQPLVWLLNQCDFVVTDSGGLQEEAPGFGKPVLVLREVTERPEGVEAGTAQLIGSNAEAIVEWITRLLKDPATYLRMARTVNPYGTGNAAEQIAAALVRRLPSAVHSSTDRRDPIQIVPISDVVLEHGLELEGMVGA